MYGKHIKLRGIHGSPFLLSPNQINDLFIQNVFITRPQSKPDQLDIPVAAARISLLPKTCVPAIAVKFEYAKQKKVNVYQYQVQ